MANRFISPALADLSQDIAGPVSLDIVKKWIEGNGTEQEAEEILNPYAVRGTVVSTDTSGLSRLSLEKELLDVLKIISDPKEIVYGLGTSIGGKALGRWVADNTQMFYDAGIDVPDVIRAMLQANAIISKECRVLIGFGIHHGAFLNIGNGMYGKEADFVEAFAENNAKGGELLISESVVRKINQEKQFVAERAEDLSGQLENIYRLYSEKSIGSFEIKDREYPISFDKRFFSLLRNLEENGVRDTIYREYLSLKTVVLLQRGPVAVAPHVGGLLDNLVINTAVSATLKKIALLYKNAREIKNSGGLAIFIFDPEAVETAVAFSHAARMTLYDEKISCTIGIDSGSVLLFPLEDKTRDIAGSPVNICSKLASDFGEPGNIYITEKAAQSVSLPEYKKFSANVSHVIIQGYVL